MYPSRTTYRLMEDKDYNECQDIYEENHGEPFLKPFMWPTVVAVRDDEIIGFLSTLPMEGRIMAGPLEVRGGKNMITFLRLIEAYTNVMKTAGVTQYEFFVDADRADNFGVERLGDYAAYGVKFNQVFHGNAFFVKEVM